MNRSLINGFVGAVAAGIVLYHWEVPGIKGFMVGWVLAYIVIGISYRRELQLFGKKAGVADEQ